MTGPDIPAPGLGTYRMTTHDECVESVRTAVEVGYRHIDTAEAYRNERSVGEALAEADVEDVFLATKVLHPRFTDDYSASSIERNARSCLERLGVDAVDLFYGVHWPGVDEYDPETAFQVCADLHDEGLFEHLGVCNMTPTDIDRARDASEVPIGVVQVEMHPLLPQAELREYCAEHDMTLVAYAPLGNGRILEVPEIRAVADEHGVSPARVSVAWCLEKGVVPIPKATGRDHIEDNWRARTLELTDADIERIDSIGRTERQYSPDYAPDW